MDGNSEDDNQVHTESRQLALALLLSLAFHTLLLSLTFGDAEFGLPGLNVFWREQKIEGPSLRVDLVAAPVAVETPPEMPAVAWVKQRKVTRVVAERPAPNKPSISPVLPAEPKPVVAIATVVQSPEIEIPEPPAAGVVTPKPAVPELTEPAEMPKLDLPEREAEPDQLKTAQLEAAQQEAARQESTRIEAARQEAVRREAERQAAEQEALRQEAARREAARIDAERQEAARIEVSRREAELMAAERRAAELEAQRQRDAHREAENRMALEEAQRQEAVRIEAARVEAERQEAARLEAERREAERREALRLEAARLAAAREEEERREARLRAIGRQLDDEARQREAAAAGSKLPLSLSTARRIKLWARTDPNVELVQYAEAMARKIQMNTPAETVRDLARRPHVDPVVTLAIRSNGSVEGVTIVVSSGVPEIDAAIPRIVQSHAPFQMFPQGLARQADVVEIRRTWYFDVAVRLN